MAKRALLVAGLGSGLGLVLWLGVEREPTRRESSQAPTDSQAGIAGQLARREYQASANGQGLQAPNRAHNLRTYFEPDGVRVHDRTAEGSPELLSIRLSAIGRDALRTVVVPGSVHAEGARVEIRRGDVVEWYENSPRGLEQGFDLASAPAGSGELWLELALAGASAVERRDGLELRSAKGRRLRYAKLAAHDASGRALPARMEVRDPSVVRLVVAEAGAEYPVTIDPLLTESEDTLLGGDQETAQLGVHVADAGDVNGDGYADAIVGANLYDAGETDEGAAFVFLGSASGIADGEAANAATQLESNQSDSLFGRSVAGAGDVNGDGYADVIVGARLYDQDQNDEGAAFIFHGGPGGIPDGNPDTSATVIQSNQGGAGLGICTAGAGDVNGDGYADVIVGAWSYDAVPNNEGAAFVFHGGAGGIADGDPTTAATQLESDQGGSTFGVTCAGAGDVNGDGHADVIVGSRDYDNPENNEGGAFVFLGSASGIADATPATAHARLESDQAGAELGWGVAGAGDVNGDGYSDVIVGAIGYDAGENAEGAAFIFLGSSTGIASGTPATAHAQLESDQGNAQLYAVGGAGDVNGDGYGDVIVGAHFYDSGEDNEGAAWVFLGGQGGIPDGNPSTAYAQLESDQPDAELGLSAAGAGDVNGDGYADVIAGAHLYDGSFTDSGAAFVFHGANQGIVDGNPTTAAAQLESVGTNVAGAGDVNGDGYADVIVGAPGYDAGQAGEGAAFVFHGGPAGIASGDPSTASAQLESDQPDADFGSSVAGAGDVNGDGYADVIVGASLYDSGESDEGAAFVFHGSASGVVDGNPATAAAQLESNEVFARLGHSVAGAGDVNGDGYSDVIVGALGYSAGQNNEGAAFVFQGGPAGIADGNPATAAAQLETNRSLSGVFSVAGAGDVNGDRYADVIVGSALYSAGQPNEGAAFVFHGSASGVADGNPVTAAAQLESNQTSGLLGDSVAGAGDVNGDGYADVIVGAVGAPDAGGGAFVFLGGPSGIGDGSPSTAATRLQAGQVLSGFGDSVAGAGDVNGDGFADVVVGADAYESETGQNGEGAAFVFTGSPSGIADGNPGNASARLEGDQAGAFLGRSVAGAGDVNGDGFADLIVHHLGGASVFLGNGNRQGRPVRAQQIRALPNPGTLVAPFGSAADTDTFRVRITRTSATGRVRHKGEVEACPNGVAFGGVGCVTTVSPTWVDPGVNPGGDPLLMGVTGLAPDRLYRWRARLLMIPPSATAPGVVPPPNPAHGPWRRLDAQLVEGDIRTLPDADLDGVADGADNCPSTPNAGQQDVDLDGIGDVCDNCPAAANTDQVDTDGDALGDVCDPDDDNDGLTDVQEVALGTNPLLADSDADGAGDAVEVNTLGTNPLDPDSDDDGALDGPDNCPLVANADQADPDGDGLGDVCDNCSKTHNPDQMDTGGLAAPTPDGVGNSCQNGDWNGDGTADLVDDVIFRRRLAGFGTPDPRMPPGP
jgi:hypothetical protein